MVLVVIIGINKIILISRILFIFFLWTAMNNNIRMKWSPNHKSADSLVSVSYNKSP